LPRLNVLVKVGLIIIVAVASNFAGKYASSLRSGQFSATHKTPLGPKGHLGFPMLLKSYDYRFLVNTGGGEVELMIFSLTDFLKSGPSSPRAALVNSTLRGGGELHFKPSRRGFYVVLFRNLGEREIYLSYLLTPNVMLEEDFMMDSLILALGGFLILLAGLIMGRRQKH